MTKFVTLTRHVAVLLMLASLVACGKKEEKPAGKQVASDTIADKERELKETIPEEAMVQAMLRGHPNARRICIDGMRERAFFLDYGPRLKPGEIIDHQYHGWLFIEKVDFYKTSNNTWFITDQPENKYSQVYPDVKGLTCRQQENTQ